ncbi:MAG: hypothetical protein CSA72_01920 [Rhodobacterales bacterium]|nr:MAG: hypothetical protein CSA72_01920 [Rhodobacterales bacterium]
MDWTAPIDIYCERLSDAFWAEPLNALSNLSFIAAAIWAGMLARRTGVRSADTVALIVLAFCVGVGSFMFHTFANGWSSLADVIPIWTFVALFTLSAIVRIGGVKPGKAVTGAVVLIAVLVVVFMAAGTGSDTDNAVAAHEGHSLLNGSEQYFPAVIALLVFTFIARRRESPMAPWITLATITFISSLTLRTLDMHLCEIWPNGTHFLWHLLNGLMIGILLDGYIKLQARSQGAAPA